MAETKPLQPLLHDRMTALRAPIQVWTGPDGSIGTAPIDGVYLGDTRVLDRLSITVVGAPGEHIATLVDSASRLRFSALHRALDAPGADPDVRSTFSIDTAAASVAFTFSVASRMAEARRVAVIVEGRADATAMEHVKAGIAPDRRPDVTRADEGGASWSAGAVQAHLEADDAVIDVAGAGIIRMTWVLDVPARGSATARWRVGGVDSEAVVTAPTTATPWTRPVLDHADDRLRRWISRALDDLDALRLESTQAPGESFLAAGAPWFFTLFGRDSIWSARFMLPLGPAIAASTLRVLARFQGTTVDVDTAEQPGKIMHELRRTALVSPDGGFVIPPLYYGTVDATPLWVCLLHDAWRAGMDAVEVEALLPHVVAALEWMRDFGDSDGDGLLEYVDETGRGLANQGWKDSGDSVQWRDGSFAEGPIALCEVQGYAYEAAMHGADLLDAFGGDGAPWREWALRLAAAFHERFWIDDPDGAYPAIAVDAHKRAVDSLTSNIGHLLGTGLLDGPQSELVARRLVSPDLDSGFGVRTLSTDAAGYWPLSYHGGSVWAHDTAIAVFGLSRAGFAAEARRIAEGLLAAAPAFDYRMPELYAGDAASDSPIPAPYPAACRPQAWSAAAAIGVWDALTPRGAPRSHPFP